MSSFTFEGVDILMAQKILDWNLRRYPNGVFFLFGQGRLRLIRGQPALAIESYHQAMKSQNQYANLHQISYWEIATSNLSLWKVSESLECWRHLYAESSWSKAIYTYGIAVCLLQLGGDERKKEAAELLEKIPSLQQRIAGKSIPMEVHLMSSKITPNSHSDPFFSEICGSQGAEIQDAEWTIAIACAGVRLLLPYRCSRPTIGHFVSLPSDHPRGAREIECPCQRSEIIRRRTWLLGRFMPGDVP